MQRVLILCTGNSARSQKSGRFCVRLPQRRVSLLLDRFYAGKKGLEAIVP